MQAESQAACQVFILTPGISAESQTNKAQMLTSMLNFPLRTKQTYVQIDLMFSGVKMTYEPEYIIKECRTFGIERKKTPETQKKLTQLL